MKLIIANRGARDIGKTASIKNVFTTLYAKYAATTKIYEPKNVADLPKSWVDVKAIMTIGDVLVGIESQGDPGSRMQESVKHFIKKGCEIMLVACRNQGDTINTIKDLEKKHGYTVLWLQNGKCTNHACWHKLEVNYGHYVAYIIEQCAMNKTLDPAYL